MTQLSAAQTQGRHGASGRRVLVILALVVVAVMIVGWIGLQFSTSVMATQPPLSWAQRDNWPHRQVRETTLAASGVQTLISGARWRELSLDVPANEQRVVAELAELARAEGFARDSTRQRLEQVHSDRPGLFYATYLLGHWHRIHGDDARADALFELAFADAPAAIQQSYVTPRYQPVPKLPVGKIELICYRSDGESMDDSLRLVFPELVTDEQGRIAAPVYRTVYRVAARNEPEGLVAHHSEPEVFQFPGRIGALPAAVVEQRPEASRTR